MKRKGRGDLRNLRIHHKIPGRADPEALLRKVREVLDAPTAKRLILIVDDEPAIRALLRDVVLREGYHVIEACDGIEALKMCAVTQPDLVITDLCMPECEGLETIQTFRRTFPEVRLLAMSGMTGYSTFLKAARLLGAAGTLQKPLILTEVTRTIRSLLAKQQF